MTDPAASVTTASSHEETIDPTLPQLTLRAVLTGALIGGGLALCNVYAGLKIGWGMNMSIAAVLISYGFWLAMRATLKTRPWEIQENNVNQTGASAAASISSAGLVSAVPALTMITTDALFNEQLGVWLAAPAASLAGAAPVAAVFQSSYLIGYQFGFLELALWVFCCSILGVFTAMLFRNQMLLRDKLPFASGIATAETLREVYAHGKEALARLRALIEAALLSAGLKVLGIFMAWSPVGLPGKLVGEGALAAKGITAVSPLNLTLALDPSLLLFGSGMIVGFRTGVWMLIGAFIAWGIIALKMLNEGAIVPGNPAAPWFKTMIEWVLWPGVAMLVTSSLTALAFSAPAFVRAFRGGGGSVEGAVQVLPPKMLWGILFFLGLLIVLVGGLLFGMAPHISLAAVGLTVVLAIVALRVSGETNITPVGGMGKVTQLSFGAIDPGNATTNLMAANVTGGSASQAADMMHDLKTGFLLGTSPRAQALSQCVGVLAGALAGAAIYMVLVQDPSRQLVTSTWPAPAVSQWYAVAKVMKQGFDSLPAGVPTALLIASIAGVVMAMLERLAPPKIRPWMPSPTAIGIAFCVPAWNSVSFFLGGCVNLVSKRWARAWHKRFVIVTAAGLIVGESLVGLGDALIKLAKG
ncbi:MAG: OPT/YSL family transporter [Deltaproteobacteria bacterium]|nr:OPT/YSL family transporter [Deltaproteobacteria bacterium]